MHRQLLEQCLVRFGKSIHPLRVHVEHRAHLAIHAQGNGQLTAHLGIGGDITVIGLHIAHTQRLPMAGHPAGDAFVHSQLQCLAGRG